MRLGADLPTSETLRKCTHSAGLPGKKGDRRKANNKGIKNIPQSNDYFDNVIMVWVQQKVLC